MTTNHIIFDPNVSDPLVIEYGMDKYGVDAPMNCIVRAALYSDIFRMKIKDPRCIAIFYIHSLILVFYFSEKLSAYICYEKNLLLQYVCIVIISNLSAHSIICDIF